jgi:polyisoprenoid-binding protein YceI
MRRIFPVLALLAASTLVLSSARAEPQGYQVDPVHSSLHFRIKHLGVSWIYGRFNDFAGTIVVDDDDLANAKVEVTVQAESVDTGNAKRDQHLKSPDFFNVGQFPTLSFRSSAVAKTADGYEVTGTFSLHGVEKTVKVTMKKVGEGNDPMGGHRIGFEGELTIKRSDYGMTNMLDLIGDDVRLILAFEAAKKQS